MLIHFDFISHITLQTHQLLSYIGILGNFFFLHLKNLIIPQERNEISVSQVACTNMLFHSPVTTEKLPKVDQQ